MAHMKKVIEKNRNISNEQPKKKSNDIIVTLIICVLMLLIAYGASTLIYQLTKEPSTVVDVKQYNINASSTFTMDEDEYYVMFYDKTGVDALSLSVLINNYRNSGSKSLYVVDLSKDYNKSIISDTPNPNASAYSELAISNSTLIKISDGKIAGYYENLLLIENELK